MGGLAAGMLALFVGPASAAPPRDYAAEVARAERAMAEGDPAGALEAWQAAEALSGGNLDTLIGQVPALVALGRHAEAAARARAGTAQAPRLSGAWMSRGWSTRFRPWLPQLGQVAAERSYGRAVALAPERAAAWCGLGWTRLQQGDLTGARAALETAVGIGDADGCAAAGLDLLPPPLRVDVGVAAGGSQWTDHPWRAGGWGTGAWVSTAAPGSWSVGLTANRLVIRAEPLAPGGDGGAAGGAVEEPPPEGEPPQDGGASPPAEGDPAPTDPALADAGASPSADDLVQSELWLTATGRLRRARVLLVGGQLWTSGYAEGDTTALGGRLSLPVGLTPSVEVAGSRASDGSTGLQLGGGLAIPLWRGIWVEGGAQWSRVGGEGSDERLRAAGTTGQLGGGWARPDGRAWAQVVGRLGEERRPIRLDEPGIWNVDDTLLRSLRVTGGGEPLPWLGLFAAVEAASLRSFYPPEVDATARGLDARSAVWLASGGLHLRPVGARRRGAR